MRYVALALRLTAAHPQLDASDAYLHAEAAAKASTERVAPELLLALAYLESKFDPFALARVEADGRRAGHWESTEAPKRLRKGVAMFCGPLQMRATTWEACLAQRDLRTAYTAAATQIEGWLADKLVRGNLSRALAGYGCGTAGARSGSCRGRFEARVLGHARRIAGGHAPARK